MMKRNIKNNGLTLTELVVTVSILLLLVGIGIPAVKKLFMSFESAGGVQTIISAAMANARAIAVTQQKYAGVRFQRDINGNQYMIFIIKADWSSPANGFKAVVGKKPVKLPLNACVMDLNVVERIYNLNGSIDRINDKLINSDDWINEAEELKDTTTFSIIFSPSGSLVTHQVWVRNRNGYPRSNDNSKDDVFNTINNVSKGVGMFLQDDYPLPENNWGGLGPENSRNSFVIYQKDDLAKVQPGSRWSGYLRYLPGCFINSYTGEIVNSQD